MKRIGIVTNIKKKNAEIKLKELLRWLRKKGKIVLIDEESAVKIKGEIPSFPIEKLTQKVDLVISLGGDGTLLRVARSKNIDKIPVLGVNLGGLGFITETVFPEIYDVLENIFTGKFKTEERMLLGIEVSKGRKTKEFRALNDIVLAKTTIARLLHLEIFVDKDYVTTYQSDGLIIATPTGSTGHSLSAGGPIMEPTLEGIILTPICPHTLTNRPLIIPADKKVKIKAKPSTRAKEICATIDGQIGLDLSFDEEVVVKKLPAKLRLVVSPKRNYYQVLREKFSWGKRGEDYIHV